MEKLCEKLFFWCQGYRKRDFNDSTKVHRPDTPLRLDSAAPKQPHWSFFSLPHHICLTFDITLVVGIIHAFCVLLLFMCTGLMATEALVEGVELASESPLVF